MGTDTDQPTRSLGTFLTHAGLLLAGTTVSSTLGHLHRGLGGGEAFWHAGPGRGLGPLAPPVGLSLGYKNVPGIPINTAPISCVCSVIPSLPVL